MQIFARRLPAFTHVEVAAVAFAGESARARLLESSVPGDMMVVAGFAHEPTAPRDRGLLLGFVEFAPVPVGLADLCGVDGLPVTHRADDGSATWPYALPVVRAWTFDEPRMRVSDAFRDPLVLDPVERAVELDAEEAKLVHLLPKTEVAPSYDVLRRRSHVLARAVIRSVPTTGPKPSAWTAEVAHDPNAEAWTYLMRFGNRDVWKVGHTQDLERRLEELNLHVPYEALNERWALVLTQRWENSVLAYEAEQRILAHLQMYRTVGERLVCSEGVVVTHMRSSCRPR
jgi:predicted GIY-YIG superfamily endonuclease